MHLTPRSTHRAIAAVHRIRRYSRARRTLVHSQAPPHPPHSPHSPHPPHSPQPLDEAQDFEVSPYACMEDTDSAGEASCRICLMEEGELVAACNTCRGSCSLVHEECLNRWRTQFHPTDDRARLCDICRTPYRLLMPAVRRRTRSLPEQVVPPLVRGLAGLQLIMVFLVLLSLHYFSANPEDYLAMIMYFALTSVASSSTLLGTLIADVSIHLELQLLHAYACASCGCPGVPACQFTLLHVASGADITLVVVAGCRSDALLMISAYAAALVLQLFTMSMWRRRMRELAN